MAEGLNIPDDAKIEVLDRPLHERLRPQSSESTDTGENLHASLITPLKTWIRESKYHIKQRSADWEQVDEHMRLYLNLDRNARSGDKGSVVGKTGPLKENPWQRMIAIPLTYSTILTRMVHMFGIFTQVDPFFHLQPVGGEDKRLARVHEVVMARDAMLSEISLQTWQMLFDAEKYGFGIWYDTWEEEWGWTTSAPILNPALKASLPQQLRPLAEKQRKWSMLQEWNRYRAIDPHTYLPDPNVPVIRPQMGTRCGHWEITNWLELKSRALEDESGPYFNLERAKKTTRRISRERDAGRWMEGQFNDAKLENIYPDLEVEHLQVKLIPKDYNLSATDKPEIWWFSVVEEELIIRCHPSPYAHNKLTYSAGSGDPDFHSSFAPGMGQQLIGGQNVVNWFLNSHMANIRKTVNDQVIYNDNLLSEPDILSPGPARHIRLTTRGKQVHERGVMNIDQMYSQFRITDVTEVHLKAVGEIIGHMQMMAATPDPVTGMPLPTKRTLGEIEQVSGAATARIQTSANLLDLQVTKPAAERNISNRQQWTSVEEIYRIAGRLAEELDETELRVRPEDLYGRYDYIAKTPSMVSDPARSNALWGSLLQVLGSAPQLLEPDPLTGKQIDAFAVFKEFIKSAGVNYFDDFFKDGQPQLPAGGVDVMEDEAIQQGVDAGNLVPMGQGVPGVR